MLTVQKAQQAAKVLSAVARKTDLIRAPKLSATTDVYLKTENLQVTGSFKLRGAYYKMSTLTEEQRKRGVVGCSAGNHAQGIALAAKEHGIKAVICLPDNAPITKIEATRAMGAEVELVEGAYDDAYNRALELSRLNDYTLIHPFDDEDVIAGQGTIGLEIIEQLPDVEAVVVPIGGGGLISGVAAVIKKLKPSVKVYGVQAAGAKSMLNAFKDKHIECLSCVSTVADGIAVKRPAERTYEYCNRYVDDIVSVNDDEISTAILSLIENQKLIAEGAGAVSVAAVLFGKIPVEGKKTVCIVSGGNIDVTILSRIIKRGLLMMGRTCQLTLELVDKPGQLSGVSRVISEMGGNVTSVRHDRSNEGSDINGCFLKILMETRDFAHIERIKKALTAEGYKIVGQYYNA